MNNFILDSNGKFSNGRYFMDTFAVDYYSIISNNHNFFSNFLRSNARLLFWVCDECKDILSTCFRDDISIGLQNWECVFSMRKEWFVANYKLYPELKQHFMGRPGLWFYIFRYDQKKINPRTGEVSKDLSDAWMIMDYWDISHNWVEKIGNEYKIVSKN